MVQSQPLGLDPWTDIVAVHWSPGGDTKLDFYNKKYMVRGKIQLLADVLGVDFDFNSALSQRALVTADVLDLRRYSGGHLLIAPSTAWLKNKTTTPSKTNPGALNEFLRMDWTMVMEFDWPDIYTEVNWAGGFPEGLDVSYQFFGIEEYLDTSNRRVLNIANAESKQAVGTISLVNAGAWHYPLNTPSDGINPPTWGPAVWVPGSSPDGVGFPRPLQGEGIIFPWWTQPPDEPFTTADTVGDIDYTIEPAVAVYETTYDDGYINGRMVGAAADAETFTLDPFVPSGAGVLPIPYGRNRVAVTISSSKLEVSVNGRDAIKAAGTPLITSPRAGASGSGSDWYYPISYTFPELSLTQDQNLEALFNAPLVVRCVWLTRTKRSAAALKQMSVVRPLPLAASDYWPKMPDKDHAP